MTVDDLRQHYRAKTDMELAEKLQRAKSTLSKWRKCEIPVETQAYYQLLTKGKLKANLSQATV